MNIVVNFTFNLLFFRTFFLLEESKNPQASAIYFENIANDLQRIGFYFEFNINYNLLTIFISIVISFFTYFLDKNSIKLNDLTSLKNYFLKTFSLNATLLLSFLYFLRGYNFSRFYLIVLIIIYPILIFIIDVLVSKNRFASYILFSFFLACGAYLIFKVIGGNELNVVVNESIDSTFESNKIVGLEYADDGQCFEWQGSSNFDQCITGSTFTVLDSFGDRLSNLIFYNQKLYILESSGEIYEYNLQTYEKKLYLDLSEKVFYDPQVYSGSGLFSMAFHPDNNYFLVSYSNLENNLSVEKFKYNNEMVDINSSKTLINIPSNDCCHYSGNIIWSKHFKDFLLSVGDMGNKFNSSDTTTPKGKVILLNTNETSMQLEIPLVGDSAGSTPLKNIVAYGLRNPWKTFEYENYLFIPDVGLNDMEELNIIDLNKLKSSIYFGWPLYEGLLITEDKFFPISYWDKSENKNLLNFAKDNTVFPIVYYEHNSTDVFRAAIIGGDVVDDENSEYYKNYIFADYLSKELFAYSFLDDKISILPLPDNFDTYITSLIVNPLEKDSVLITTGVGELIKIKLP